MIPTGFHAFGTWTAERESVGLGSATLGCALDGTHASSLKRTPSLALQQAISRPASRRNSVQRSISRVLFPEFVTEIRAMTIHLGCVLPRTSSDATRERWTGHPLQTRGLPALLFDLAPGGVYRTRMSPCGSVSSYLTLSPLRPGGTRPQVRGLLSVALSLRSPSLDVIQHPALWSSDFPPARPGGHASGHLFFCN